MKSIVTIFCGIVIVFAFCVSLKSGDEPLKEILTKLENFRSSYPQEKVHLHLDKSYYAIGDNIWFKAYVVDAESHRLSALSKSLTVELINEKDSIKKSIILPLRAGLAWGDFQLPDSLREGNYRIRAYTAYMRNFDNEYFFDKTIQIANAISNSVITTVTYQYETQGGKQKINATINFADIGGGPLRDKKVNYNVQADSKSIARGKDVTDQNGEIKISFVPTQNFDAKTGILNTLLKLDELNTISKNFPIKSNSNDTDVQFFPEGGHQIYGLRSKVGFKAVSANGKGKKITGYLSTASGQKVLEFESEFAGIGSFTHQPLFGESYVATIVFPDGSEKKSVLAKPLSEGFTLGAINTDAKDLLVKISASQAVMQKGGEFTLVAQSNSVVKFVSKNKLENSVFNAKIPKDRFPTGILQLTLFDQMNQPVAERLVFINHEDFLEVSVNGPKTSSIRQKVELNLNIKDASGTAVLGSVSVSVTDATKAPVDGNKETTILTNLLLTSDIKGYVEDPNHYFNSSDQVKVKDLDNLMLTQGWRRFSWKNILTNNFPSISKTGAEGISISGRIIKNRRPVANGKVLLLSSKNGFFLTDALTDSDGRFAFNDLIFADTSTFVIQAMTEKDKRAVDIVLDSDLPYKVTKNINKAELEVNVNKALDTYLKNSFSQFADLRRNYKLNRAIMLEDVNIVDKRVRIKGSASLSNNPDAVLTSEDFGFSPSLDQALIGKVAGLGISKGIPYLMRHQGRGSTMQVYLDGVRVANDILMDINPTDIEGVEVLKGASAAIYGIMGSGGVLIVTSKSPGIYAVNNYAEGVVTYLAKGYYKAREFYAPNYDGSSADAPRPDLRTTIFWQPNVAVQNGKGSVQYFNADGKGPYHVTIEGIDVNGKLARHVYKYQVN